MSPEEENALDEMLFDVFGRKLMLAKEALGRADGSVDWPVAVLDGVSTTLEALDNLYALLSHRLMGEETR